MIRESARAGLREAWRALRARGGEIAYYGVVALALSALAVGAESYRRGREIDATPDTLPALEPAASATEAPASEEAVAMPEGAVLLRGYASTPGWNEALGLWESHPAVDYRLTGGEVLCLLPGTVRSVERAGALGGCLEVACGEALLRYASIEPREDLLPGDVLEAGEAIGIANVSMPGESGAGAHLHLELIVDGESLDFAAWAERRSLGAGD